MTTALITGASSGIGQAIAMELASKSYELVLIGRDANALANTRKACLETGSSKVLDLTFDLSLAQSSNQIFAELAAKDLQIDVLVNNAGIGVHGNFAETPLERELDLVHIQIDSMLSLTKLLLPGMIARKKGRFLNVSSVYSFSPVPKQSVYAATKAFMMSFSESLAFELKGSDITVTVLCPGSTKTDFRRRAGITSTSGMPAEEVARCGVEAMEAGQFLAVPGFYNNLFTKVMKHIPQRQRAKLMQTINSRRGL